MEKRAFKNKAYTLLSQMVKAMANPHRLEIIDLLGQRGRTVYEIALETEMSVANASQHLQELKASNLVEVQREGNYIRYQLANDSVFQTWANLREVGFERVAEINKLIQDYRGKRSSLEAITIDELVTRMKSKNIVLLDIRPIEEFNSGHIPGALSVPLETLPALIKTFPKNKEYIEYCRGPLCVFADDAVSILNKKGYKAKRLEQGFPDWKLKGLPVHAN
ncbi:MAG: ArsR/SmtB family transcription factor [Ginsengibacter sp.]